MRKVTHSLRVCSRVCSRPKDHCEGVNIPDVGEIGNGHLRSFTMLLCSSTVWTPGVPALGPEAHFARNYKGLKEGQAEIAKFE